MKKTILKLMAFALFMTVFIYVLSACGRSNRNGEDSAGNATIGCQNIAHGQEPDATLTISVSYNHLHILQESAERYRQYIAEQGMHIQIDFIDYNAFTADEWFGHYNLLLSKFAAGTAPDILRLSEFRMYQFIENGFLASICDVIDRSSLFIREDFYMNVLEGLEVNGRTYLLPLFFGIDFVGINTNAPRSFVSRFEALDRVYIGDFTAMYLDLVSQHAEWADFALIHGLNASQAFNRVLNNAVDFGGRSADFSAYTGLLENIRTAFYGNHRFETPFLNWGSLENDLAILQERYVFSRIPAPFSPLVALFEYRDPFFIYRPMADDSGRLITSPNSVFAINHAANPDLVMGFINQVAYDQANDNFRFGLNIPIFRQYFDRVMATGFGGHTSTQIVLPPTVQGYTFEAENAAARLKDIAHGRLLHLLPAFCCHRGKCLKSTLMSL